MKTKSMIVISMLCVSFAAIAKSPQHNAANNAYKHAQNTGQPLPPKPTEPQKPHKPHKPQNGASSSASASAQ